MSTEFSQIPSFITEKYSSSSFGRQFESPATVTEDRKAVIERSAAHYAFYDENIKGIREYLAREYRGDTMHNPNLVKGSYSRKTNKMVYRDTGEFVFINEGEVNYLPHSRELIIRDQYIERNFHVMTVTNILEGEQYHQTPSGEVIPSGEFIDGISGRETIVQFTTHIWPDGQYVPTESVYSPETIPLQVIFEETKVSA